MWLFLPLLAVLLLDFATKYWATHGLATMPDGRMEVIPGFLDFFLRHNTGAAFSMLDRYPMVILVVASVAVVLILAWALRIPPRLRLARACFGMILGGALGNLYDRIAFGHVIDFIHFHRGDWYFATFNVADSFICIGIGIFLYLSVFTKQLDPPKPAEAPALPPGAESGGTNQPED